MAASWRAPGTRQESAAPLLQGALLDERDTQPGVLLALVTLLLGIVSRSYEGYEALAPRVVRLLERLLPERREGGAREAAPAVGADYHYYGIPSPWLQVRRRCRCVAAALAARARAAQEGRAGLCLGCRSSACACCSTSRRRTTRPCCAA